MILKRYGKLLAILLSVLAFNLIYFDTGIPIPGTLGFLIFIGIANLFFLLISQRLHRNTLIVFALSLIVALISLSTAAPFARFLTSITSIGLLLMGVYLLVTDLPITRSLSEAVLIPLRLGLGWLSSLLTTHTNVVPKSSTKRTDWQARLTHTSLPLAKITRGLLLTIPFALIMIVLLSSADPVFGRLVSNILKLDLPEIPQELINRVLMTLLILVVAIPLLYLKLRPTKRSLFPASSFTGYATEATVLVTILSLILAIFLVIQFRYLFSSVPETQLHQFGVQTYSEYVRRGFTELSLVTVVVYLASGLSYIIARANTFEHKALRVATYILLGLTTLFIFSIFRRVYLYQLEHGLSVARVYGMIFLGIISSILLVLALRMSNHFKAPWHLIELGLLSLFAITPSIVRPDALIAQHNPPTVNQEVDYIYLSNLSADAVDGWITSYNQVLNWLSLNEGIFEQTEITDEQYRHLSYHLFTINNLITNYEHLSAIYGQDEVASMLRQSIGNYYDQEHLEFLRKNHLAFYNLSEQQAYSKLHGAISPAEIVAIQQRISTFLSTINTTRLEQYQFDRSFDTPLVD